MSNIIKTLFSRNLALNKAIARVFQYDTTNLTTQPIFRTGRKFLTPLKGPELTSYYPEQFNITDFIKQNPSLNLPKLTADEDYRLEILNSRKRRGKGAPKKGQGRRSTLKKK